MMNNDEQTSMIGSYWVLVLYWACWADKSASKIFKGFLRFLFYAQVHEINRSQLCFSRSWRSSKCRWPQREWPSIWIVDICKVKTVINQLKLTSFSFHLCSEERLRKYTIYHNQSYDIRLQFTHIMVLGTAISGTRHMEIFKCTWQRDHVWGMDFGRELTNSCDWFCIKGTLSPGFNAKDLATGPPSSSLKSPVKTMALVPQGSVMLGRPLHSILK